MNYASKKWLAGMISMVFLFTLIVGCSSNNSNGGNASSTASAPPSSSAASPSESAAESESDVYPENNLSKTEKVTLKFGFAEQGYGREWFDSAIEKFTALYPNVSFDITSSPMIADLISTKIAAKNDEDMFDIVSPVFNGTEKIDAIRAGLFEDMSDQWDRELLDSNGKKFSELVPAGTKEFAAQVDGKYYELPMNITTVGLFFDKALFEKHGWNQNPKTYEEFEALLEAIKTEGIIPITYPGIYPGYLDFGFLVKRFELADHNGNLDAFMKSYRASEVPLYTSPESKEVWNRIYELGKKGYFPEGVAAINHTQSQMQLLQHEAALALTGDWVQNEMKDAIPEGFKWGFMAIPFSSTEGDSIWIENYLGAGGGMIWKNKPELNKSWAKEFLAFLLTNDVQAYNNKIAGLYPIREDFHDNPDNLLDMQDAPKAVMEFAKNNNVKYGITQQEVSLTHPSAVTARKIISEATVEITSGKKDPAPILEEVDKLIQEALDAQ